MMSFETVSAQAGNAWVENADPLSQNWQQLWNVPPQFDLNIVVTGTVCAVRSFKWVSTIIKEGFPDIRDQLSKIREVFYKYFLWDPVFATLDLDLPGSIIHGRVGQSALIGIACMLGVMLSQTTYHAVNLVSVADTLTC